MSGEPRVIDLREDRKNNVPGGLAQLRADIQAVVDPNAKAALRTLAKILIEGKN